MRKKTECNRASVKRTIVGVTLIFICVFLYILTTSKSSVDISIVALGIIGQIMLLIGILLNTDILILISHLIYSAILMVAPFITRSREILLSCLLLSQFTIVTRKKYNCMFEYFHSSIINTEHLNWDYLYSIPGVVSAVKLYYNN